MKCFFNHKWGKWSKPEEYLAKNSDYSVDMGIKSNEKINVFGSRQHRECLDCGRIEYAYFRDKTIKAKDN